jgi:hypothetical protein
MPGKNRAATSSADCVAETRKGAGWILGYPTGPASASRHRYCLPDTHPAHIVDLRECLCLRVLRLRQLLDLSIVLRCVGFFMGNSLSDSKDLLIPFVGTYRW